MILGATGALITKQKGYHWGLVDIPNDRSSHNMPTPKGGGIGILGAFIIVAVWGKAPIGFWAPITLLALVSLLGDRQNLSVTLRLIVQMFAAILVLWVGLSPEILSIQSNLFLSVPLLIFLSIFIIGTANIYNFMDGINGIAGITGVIGFILLAWYGMCTNSLSFIVIMCLALVAACLGFLPFNIPKAKVFMGDVGSILLGFVFATVVAVLANNPAEFFALAACLFPFYADELTTMVVRVRDGEQLSFPHRRHMYQLLANEMGIAHWKISLGYGLCQLIVGFSAIALSKYGSITMIFLGFCFIIFIIISNQVRKKIAT